MNASKASHKRPVLSLKRPIDGSQPNLPSIGGLGVGRIKRLFEINSCQFVQVTHDEHPYWMQVIPREALSPLPPSDLAKDDWDDDLELPF